MMFCVHAQVPSRPQSEYAHPAKQCPFKKRCRAKYLPGVRQGINTAEFDTAEFEVVKSRLTLQKERKEQREQEEKAAAQKALAEAAAARKAAQLAARKAVHEAARDQMKAQRELHKAEAQASYHSSVRPFWCLFGAVSCVCSVRHRHGLGLLWCGCIGSLPSPQAVPALCRRQAVRGIAQK